MKYEEMTFEFVQCDKIDPSNKHDDENCETCMEFYELLKDDIFGEFQFQNQDKEGYPKREIVDFHEVSNHEDFDNGRMLKFGIWSMPI